MTNQLIILPIILHLTIAVLLLLMWNRPQWHRWVSVGGSSIMLVISMILFYQVWSGGTMFLQSGNWQAPFGITLVADTFAALLVVVASIVGLAIVIYSGEAIIGRRSHFGYFAIVHFILMGLNGAFLTGDIFNLYVWFEIIIISSFVLMTIGGEKKQIEGGVKYFTLNVLASIIFLTGIGVLYGLTGTLHMADLSIQVKALSHRGLVDMCAVIFLVGFGIKSALFPLYFWLPSSYHTPPSAISALFGGLMTKVGVYAMIRVFTLIFGLDDFLQWLMIIMGGMAVLSGGLGALWQVHLKKILAFMIICHVGYMVLGLALRNEMGLTGTAGYMMHDIIVKCSVFLMAGIVYRICGTFHVDEAGGMAHRYPKLSLLFAIAIFSLVGIPPLSGFWPKIGLLQGSLNVQQWTVLVLVLAGSLLTLIVMARTWASIFWQPENVIHRLPNFLYYEYMNRSQRTALILPVILLVAVMLFMGLGAGVFQTIAARIASELMHPEQYVALFFTVIK